MRKIFTVLFAIFALLFTTQSLFAAVGDYKNNLLKIEITKLDEDSYDIGLYTQKVYNEPVKIIKKTDTVYYFLLPETSNSITSVTPNDAVKNVLIKSYPYAGQDMENSYTKVAIITSKPVNLSTSLRTLDTSISPRLDPIRLARLDKVFERYSDRLAENNIPTPLSEFRKQTVVAQRPNLESNVSVKEKEEKIASSKTPAAKPAQTVQKPKPAAQTTAKKTQPVKQAVKKPAQTTVKKPVVVAQKPKTQTVVKKQQQVQTVKKQPTQTTKVAVNKPAVAAKPAAVAVKQVQKPQTKPLATTPVQKTVQKQEQPKIAYSKETAPSAVQTHQAQTKPQPVDNKTIKLAQKQAEERKQVEEFEKQLATTEPIDAEFGKKVPVENLDENKDIKAEIVEPIQNIPQKNMPQKSAPASNSNNNTYVLLGLFVVLFALYVLAKKNSSIKQKQALETVNKQNKAKTADDIKEFLKQRTAIKKQAEELLEKETDTEEIANVQPAMQPQQIEPAAVAPQMYVQNQAEQYYYEEPAAVADSESEKIEAFNAYMDNISEDIPSTFEAETTLQAISDITEDDAVIAQLYTPIENVSGSYATYTQENEVQPIVQQGTYVESANNNDDVATIVSSSKLTETRGLYLAKFEGATSLVGYIQDDIYVLYNFGDVNVQDTRIESSLAQENDTDSIYIVKTGGKKLMVKSTPYDMSLEMVM